ncbi:MAG: tryptophan--tRNA ligase [Planctomycetota bacterium]
MRVVSGIQPSGDVHLGNYFGAIRQFLTLEEEHECFFFVADYHALTTVRDGEALRRRSIDCVRDYLALGLDGEKAAIFLQSDVPELTELAWVLSTVTPLKLLEGCEAYKEKIARGLPPDHGLFAYPVLMAADILIYRSELVPVGRDQQQHVEVACEIAKRFNKLYGEVFRIPKAYMIDRVAIITGTDGRKMSKSFGNTIGVFDTDEEVRAKVMGIQTNSQAIVAPRDPLAESVFALFRLFADDEEYAATQGDFQTAKIGNREVKKRLIELVNGHFAEARRRYRELEANPQRVWDVLAKGREKARGVARETLARVREAVGLSGKPGAGQGV